MEEWKEQDGVSDDEHDSSALMRSVGNQVEENMSRLPAQKNRKRSSELSISIGLWRRLTRPPTEGGSLIRRNRAG